jgi:predicted aspartyl protease
MRITCYPLLQSSSFRRPLTLLIIAGTALTCAPAAPAGQFDRKVPLKDKGASTYYVPCQIEGYGEVEMLVDTGSAYTTINEKTLSILRQRGLATYVKDMIAKLADGAYKTVPIYRITSISIGDVCEIEDVETAVLPGNTRSLLGLNALNKTGPIMFSLDPPHLMLSNCE